MKLAQDELRRELALAASRVVAAEDAGYFAAEVVEAHLRKAPRVNPLREAAADIEACLAAKASVETVIDLPAATRLDFGGHGPLPYLKTIHDQLEGKADAAGLAMTTLGNSTGMHTLHLWVQGLAKRGLVAIAVANGGPNAVIPAGGTRGLFGTNPLAYGFPGADGEPVCVDMATSEIPYFQILAAHRQNEPLPAGAAVDAQGSPTTDAAAALDFTASATDPVANLLPLGGGYKGYLLVYLLELLTSGLIGMPSSPEMSAEFVPEEHGALLLAFSPAALGTAASLTQSMEALSAAIRVQPARDGGAIRLPSEGNEQSYRAAGNRGEIEVDDETLARLRGLGDEFAAPNS